MVVREELYEMILTKFLNELSQIYNEKSIKEKHKIGLDKLFELEIILDAIKSNSDKSPLDVIQNIDKEEIRSSFYHKFSDDYYFKWIINNVDDIIAIFDLNLNLEFINDAQKKYSGFSKEEIIGENMLKFIHPDDKHKVPSVFRKTFKKGYGEAEFRMRKKDGDYLWLHGKGHLVKKEGKEKIIVLTRDISKRKKMEKNLEHLNKKLEQTINKRTKNLKETQKKYRIINENVSDLILVIDAKLNITYLNYDMHKDILGYSKKKLTRENFVKILHPDDWEKAKNMIEKVFENGKVKFDIRLRHKNEKYIWFEAKARRFEDKDGYIKVIVISRDITSRKRYEDELKEINRLKSEILRRSSHELKTPLVAIKGNTNLLLENYSNYSHEDIIELLLEIRSGSERLQDLINEILKTSKLDGQKNDFNPKLENLSFLISFVINELKGYIRARKHDLIVELHDKLMVRFEKEKIYDVITNLLSNAIKYTPKRGMIKISSKNLVDRVVISIEDNGLGFTEKQKNQIFKKFGKIERYGEGFDVEIDGHVLGLYNSKKIIELHGGELWMETPGRYKGSTFFFSLPK